MKTPETRSGIVDEQEVITQGMYITVKFGDNESLLCNPSCAVINLLSSIKRRAGYANTNVLLDLSDDTGVVKELDAHQYDYATKYLASHGTYILVEKQMLPADPADEEGSTPSPPQYQYTPLLDNYSEQFPNYRLHVVQTENKKTRKNRQQSKSPSPAGVRGTKSKPGKPVSRAPSRKK